MTEPTIDKYVEAAQRELRVRAWDQHKSNTAFRELMRRRGQHGLGFGAGGLVAAGLAVAAAVLLAIIAFRTMTPGARPSATVARELQRIALGDETEVRFEHGTELDVREQTEARVVVRLQAGSARFKVRHDPRRVFQVLAGAVEVEDNGTAFEIEHKGEVVTVSVSEGAVSVSFQPAGGDPRRKVALKAGDRGVYPAHPTGPEAPGASAVSRAEATPAASASGVAVDASSSQPSSDWRVLARAGNYRGAYNLIAPSAFKEVRDEPGDLLLASDVARLSHHSSQAVRLLRQVLSRHQRDPRAPSAAFTLGWVLMNELGRPREAALAFLQAESLAPRGNLSEDALARAVESWYRASELARARAELERYRARYPQGRHLATLQRLAGVP
jgi:transmembrane sensor